MRTPSLIAAVRGELLAHPDVTEGEHAFGGIVFHVRGHEIGHLHGERIADLPFPADMLDELVTSGRVLPQHIVSDSAWISRTVEGSQDVADIVELFRISYEHAASRPAAADTQERQLDDPSDSSRRRPAGRRAMWASTARALLRRRRHR